MQMIKGKGVNMEFLILFISSIILCVLSGWLYLKKEDTAYDKTLEQIKTLRGEITSVQNDLSKVQGFQEAADHDLDDVTHRIDKVEVDIVEVRKPQTVNLVMRQPLKVLVKQVPTSPSPPPLGPFKSSRSYIPQIKKQLKTLSQ